MSEKLYSPTIAASHQLLIDSINKHQAGPVPAGFYRYYWIQSGPSKGTLCVVPVEEKDIDSIETDWVRISPGVPRMYYLVGTNSDNITVVPIV